MIKRILIVDDSPMIHMMMRKCLEAQGYEVCGDAKNGAEAVELTAALKPDLTFLDVTMPVMDGIEALGKMKEVHPAGKVIMLTAMGDEEIVQKAQSLGAELFLKKPFDEYKIISSISKIDI